MSQNFLASKRNRNYYHWKKKDLILIDGNSEEHISDVRNTEIVFKNGVGFDPKKIFTSLNGKVGLY